MKKKSSKLKKVIFGLIIISLSFLLSIHGGSNRLEVRFFDVGQGDATLITVAGKKILIDGGPNDLILRRLGESLPFLDKKIDLIILSHYHDDHVSGLIEVLKRYEVGEVIYLKNSPSSLVFEKFIRTINDNSIKSITLDSSINIYLDKNCLLSLFAPGILSVPVNNNNSIITKLDCYQKKFLFSGDNENKVEQALLTSELDIKADVFKASHHGSKTSNGEDFLRMVSPSKVIISVGEDNKFNHPSSEVVDRLNNLGIDIYRTDQHGTVKIIE